MYGAHAMGADGNRPETDWRHGLARDGSWGNWYPIAVDHLETDQVKGLVDRIRTDHGHIDVLVNDIWGGELLKGGPGVEQTNLGAQPRERLGYFASGSIPISSAPPSTSCCHRAARRPARRSH